MIGNAGHVMNLANSIIGVGLLAMPFCFKQCGIILSIAMLILSNVISRSACHFLVKSSAVCRRRNFEFLAFYTFGPSGKLFVELGVIGFMMGTCVAFFVVMGDLGPAIISKILNINNNSTLRTSVLISLGVLVILPLGLLRNVESLVAISTATIGFYFLFTLKIFFESSPHLIAGDWWYHVNFWNSEGVLQCIPIFAMSLSCQTQLFEIYESLSTPTVEKINSVVYSAINLCTVVYASVGFLGYVAYCKGGFTGNILLSFTPSFSSEMFKLGFVMSIAVSFPLVIFPCRASLYSLIFKRIAIHHESSQTSSHIPDLRFKWLTIIIVFVSLVTGLLIPSIELVLGFVGSTIGVAICVIFPSLSFINLNNKNNNDKIKAKVTVIIGVLIMILGTFGNLFAAVDNKSVELPSAKLINMNGLAELKVWPKKEISMQSSMKDIRGVSLINSIPPVEKLSAMKPSIPAEVDPGKKVLETQRKEPPVPVAPASEPKANRKFSISKVQVEVNKKKKGVLNTEKVINAPEIKPNENISKDAIEKEEREIMEVEKQKKAENDQKERELLKVLKEHQDEQKKLLREQEKILIEMKNREIKNEKKLNEILKEKAISDYAVPNKKTIKLKALKSNNKSNIVEKSKFLALRHLKERQGGNAFNVEIKAESVPNSSLLLQSVVGKDKGVDVANNTNSLPLSSAGAKKINSSILKLDFTDTKSDRKVGRRDILNDQILEGNRNREKRNINKETLNIKVSLPPSETEKCLKNNENIISADLSTKNKIDVNRISYIDNRIPEKISSVIASQKPSELIKDSKHLSVDVTNEKKSLEANVEGSKLIDSILGQSVIEKESDLKSVVSFDN